VLKLLAGLESIGVTHLGGVDLCDVREAIYDKGPD
jgi:hypothetical protein